MAQGRQTSLDPPGYGTPDGGTHSVERLHHFCCAECEKWWSIGDAPVERNRWFCPWCGCNQQFESHRDPLGNSAQGEQV